MVIDGGHYHLFSHLVIENYLNFYLIVADVDEDEVYKIVSKNNKLFNPVDCKEITHLIMKKFTLEKDTELLKDLDKIIEKFKKYFKYQR